MINTSGTKEPKPPNPPALACNKIVAIMFLFKKLFCCYFANQMNQVLSRICIGCYCYLLILQTHFAHAVKGNFYRTVFTWFYWRCGPFRFGTTARGDRVLDDQRRFSGVGKLEFIAHLIPRFYLSEIMRFLFEFHY